MLNQNTSVERSPSQWKDDEIEQFHSIVADLEASCRAACDTAMTERYRTAREDDIRYHGAEIACLERYARSDKLRDLCEAAIEKYNIDCSWPAAEDTEEGLQSVDLAVERRQKFEFEKAYLRDAESDLIAVRRRLADAASTAVERKALRIARRLHEFELVWLLSYISDDAGRATCRQVIKRHAIDIDKALARHKV